MRGIKYAPPKRIIKTENPNFELQNVIDLLEIKINYDNSGNPEQNYHNANKIYCDNLSSKYHIQLLYKSCLSSSNQRHRAELHCDFLCQKTSKIFSSVLTLKRIYRQYVPQATRVSAPGGEEFTGKLQ